MYFTKVLTVSNTKTVINKIKAVGVNELSKNVFSIIKIAIWKKNIFIYRFSESSLLLINTPVHKRVDRYKVHYIY